MNAFYIAKMLNAVFALKQQNGAVYAFYSENGFAVVDTDGLYAQRVV